MDSISQFVLGAAVGEAVLGKKIGNRAIWIGGLMGTLPDLDVLLGGNDPIRQALMHRGITHSIFGISLASPFIAWLLWKWQIWAHKKWDETKAAFQNGEYDYLISDNIKGLKPRLSQWKYKRLSKNHKNVAAPKYEETTFRNWLLFVFLALITHPLLDCFTTYGTQLFLPFSDYRVGFNTIFVADPMYTIPFLICLIAAGRLWRDSKKRRIANWLGIGLSCSYLAFTVVNKFTVDNIFRTSLEKQEIVYKRFMSSPAPLQQILWGANVEAKDGYYIGSYSHLDTKKEAQFEYLEKDFQLRKKVIDSKEMDVLRWFSNDYYVLTERENHIEYADLRFGPFDVWNVDRDSYKFIFRLKPKYEDSENPSAVPNVNQENLIPVLDENGRSILDVEQDAGPPELEEGFKKYWDDFWRRVKGI